jgi:4-alpha-glucanotransferase
MGSSLHIPHNYSQNFFVYTGTHDNNTTLGWWKNEAAHKKVEEYSGEKLTDDKIALHLCRIAYASIARVAVLPMQDILSLDETARMNMPSSGHNNWQWRLLPGQLDIEVEKRLKIWTDIYNRR